MIIEPIGLELLSNMHNEYESSPVQSVDFSALLNQGLDQVNSNLLTADKAVEDYVLQKGVDVQDVMLALEEANMSLQLAVEVRNKLLEGFQELMRMQL